MDPTSRYEADLKQRQFTPHCAQRRAVALLQTLSEQLLARATSKQQKRWWQHWWHANRKAQIQGIYLWGDVGRGKTYLMDLLYAALPFRKKMRSHYHEFMQSIHHALAQLPKQPNPLLRIADDIAEQAYVLCLDEFHVLDITDAMLLSGLLCALFERDVTLVTTANRPPNQLYQDGLQREAFLPAIALLEQHTQVVHLTGEVDYRKINAEQFTCYHTPSNDIVEQSLIAQFAALTSARNITINASVEIHHRRISTRRLSDNIVWFDFPALCATARSSLDYIALAQRFPIFFLSDIPTLGEHNNDAVMRFITLIDALYDKHRWVILTACANLEALYIGHSHAQTFRRTISRIHEMQSAQYLADCRLSQAGLND